MLMCLWMTVFSIELTTDILVNTIKKGETTGANLDKYFSHESLVHYQILYTIIMID